MTTHTASADDSLEGHNPPQAGQRWYTAEDVALILSIVMADKASPDAPPRVYPLKEVAERTLFSLDALERLCARGQVAHVKPGRRRGMTGEQMWLLIDRYSGGGDDLAGLREPATPQQELRRNILRNMNRGGRRSTNSTDLEQAREMSLKNARRATRRSS